MLPPSPQGRTGRFLKNSTQCCLSGTLPFQTLLQPPFVSVFGVSGSLESISRPKVQKPQNNLNATTSPEGRPSAWERNDRQPRDAAVQGFTWGSHKHLPGPPRCLSAGDPKDARVCGAPRPWPSPGPLPPVTGPVGHPRAGARGSPGMGPSYPPLSRVGAAGSPRWGCGARPTAPEKEGGERRERASRTHLGAHLPREPALRPGLALPLQRLRGKGKESSLPREPPQPPSPAPHQLDALTHYLARGRWGWERWPRRPRPASDRCPAGPPESSGRAEPATPKAQRGRRGGAGPGRRRGRGAGAGAGAGPSLKV